jgi:hypothetical protein
LGCCAAIGILQAYSAAPPVMGLTGQVCAGIMTIPSTKIGVAWYSPISSYLPPLMQSPYVACVEVPYMWVSTLPSISGEWVFPP